MRSKLHNPISNALMGVYLLSLFEISAMGVAIVASTRSADYKFKAFDEIENSMGGNKGKYEEFSRRAKTYETLAAKIKGFAETVGPCSNTKKACTLLENYLFDSQH